MKSLLSVMLALALFLPMVSCSHPPSERAEPLTGRLACSEARAAADGKA